MAKDYIISWGKRGPEALGGAQDVCEHEWGRWRTLSVVWALCTSFQRAQRSLAGFLAKMQTVSGVWEARRALNWKAEFHVYLFKRLDLEINIPFFSNKSNKKCIKGCFRSSIYLSNIWDKNKWSIIRASLPFHSKSPVPYFSAGPSRPSWDLKVADGVFCACCPGWVLHKPHQ